MSYHELSQETANECSRVVLAYSPDCWAEIHFLHRDMLPREKYRHYPAKCFEVCVYRAQPVGQPDLWILTAQAETGPVLLRRLQDKLAELTADPRADPSLPEQEEEPDEWADPAPPPARPGWIPTAPQTTQPLTCWPAR